MPDVVSRYLHKRTAIHGPLILTYHSVQPGRQRPAWPWAVSAERFRSHLDLLVATGWQTTTVGRLVGKPGTGQSRLVVISFDDGYADNLPAMEELAGRGMCATLFMVAGSIGSPPSWPAEGRPPGRLLNRAELRTLHAAGIEIGSHTVNHCTLTEVDEQRLRAELSDSKAILEDTLGSPVSSLAYPYGRWDARCEKAALETGYAAACTTDSGWATRDANPFRLRRLSVFNTDTPSQLLRKLTFADNDVSLRRLTAYYGSRLAERLRWRRAV